MKLNNIQIRITAQQERIIMDAAKVLENQIGETISRSEAIRRFSYERAKQILKENQVE